jgi:hypothetical protein
VFILTLDGNIYAERQRHFLKFEDVITKLVIFR